MSTITLKHTISDLLGRVPAGKPCTPLRVSIPLTPNFLRSFARDQFSFNARRIVSSATFLPAQPSFVEKSQLPSFSVSLNWPIPCLDRSFSVVLPLQILNAFDIELLSWNAQEKYKTHNENMRTPQITAPVICLHYFRNITKLC